MEQSGSRGSQSQKVGFPPETVGVGGPLAGRHTAWAYQAQVRGLT